MPRRARLRIAELPLHIIQYVNRTHRRSGTLWEGRFRSSIVQAEAYLLRCQRYIELNPVRARMVPQPAAYRWSSFGANGLGKPDALVTPHPYYLGLADTEEARLRAYREFIHCEQESWELEQIRSAGISGHALGDENFRTEISFVLGCRAGPGKPAPGRPAPGRPGSVPGFQRAKR